MIKARTVIVALVLTVIMAMPTIALAQSTPEELGLIPIRYFFEDLGGVVGWDGNDRSIHIAIDGGAVVLYIDHPQAYANDSAVILQDGVHIWQDTAFISEADIELLLVAFLSALGIEAPSTITFTLTEEARDIALYDFDYMVNAILENSPWDSVLDRAVLGEIGADFETLTAVFRAHIEAMEPVVLTVLDEAILYTQFPIKQGNDARSMAANYLFALLAIEFSPMLQNIGHLGVRTLDVYTAQITGFLRQYHDETMDSENNFALARFIETFINPATVWFYGEVDVDLDEDIRASFPNVPGNIVTEILIPGEVAFLRVNSFLTNPNYDDLVILPFLQEVQDFDHLILDVRSNGGGLTSYFNEFILRRLISEAIEIEAVEFFSRGSHSLAMMEDTLQTVLYMESIFDWQELLSVEIVDADDFIEARNMTQFNTNDLARLDYVVVSRTSISPAEDSIGFDGKVWLLVDGMSMSASALAAETALYTGFATVVGENTSGVMGSSHIYIALPTTGIIWRIDIGYRTDAKGNSLEVYGVAPQVRNFEGMDALETVLTIISTGEY